jgi:hypothetical protein
MFKPGKEKTGGRKKGSQNKLTRTVKETVLEVFNQLQEKPGVKLLDWAEQEPTEFYRIAAKLIPTDIKGEVKTTSKIVLQVVRKNTTVQP